MKFIELHSQNNEKYYININHIVCISPYAPNTLIFIRGNENKDTLTVKETYDEIVDKIEAVSPNYETDDVRFIGDEV